MGTIAILPMACESPLTSVVRQWFWEKWALVHKKNQNAKKHTHHCIGVGDNPLFELNEYFIEWIISDFFEWINLLNEYFHCVIEWIIEWIKKVHYSQEKWIKCEKLR